MNVSFEKVNSQIEGDRQDRFSLFKNTRKLITGVALSAGMVLGGCNESSAQTPVEGAKDEIVKVADNTHSVSSGVDTDKPLFEYVTSTLGIDYRILTDSEELAAMLSQGEGEWLKNARDDYEEDAVERWKDEMVPMLVTGEVSDALMEDVRDFTPNMLSLFGRIPSDQKKYSGLQIQGLYFNSEKFKTAFNASDDT